MMSPSLFNVYMEGVVREVNVRVVGKVMELLHANSSSFEVNQLLFRDDTALVVECLFISISCSFPFCFLLFFHFSSFCLLVGIVGLWCLD